MVRAWAGGAVSLCRRRNKPKTGGGLCIVFLSTGTPCLFLVILFFSSQVRANLLPQELSIRTCLRALCAAGRAGEPGSTSMGNGREKSSKGVLSKQGLKQAGLG